MQRSESVRIKITKTAVEALSADERIVDTDIDGFMARRLPSGAITYGFRYRIKGQPQRWISLGVHGRSHYTADRARKDARALAVRIENREDPFLDDKAKQLAQAKEEQRKRNTVNAVLDDYLKEQVRGEKKLRTAPAIERMYENHVRAAIGSISIHDELMRDYLNRMLKAIAKSAGTTARDRVFANVRAAFNWYAVQDSTFRNPIVKGMAGRASKARERTLSDDEIRTLWEALQSDIVPTAFADLVRNLLYTGQRRGDSADMHDREIENGNEWIIPADRYKNQGTHYAHLTERVLGMLPQTKGYKFGARTGGERPYSGFSKGKAALDGEIAKLRKKAKAQPVPHWTLHDLRRTARSLMSRAKVPTDIAEMVVGHTLKGVRKVYDRYTYAEERKDALERLSNILDSIISPSAANVVPFAKVDAK